MAVCMNCGVVIEGKRIDAKYCSDVCRVSFNRNIEVEPVTDNVTDKLVIKDLEKCRYCGVDLPPLQRKRIHLGSCYDCALKQPAKVSPATDGHILSSRPALEFTGELTDYEREHYKPASKLPKGQHNPVSKPGDSHYSTGVA